MRSNRVIFVSVFTICTALIGATLHGAGPRVERVPNWSDFSAAQKAAPKTQLYLLTGSAWDKLSPPAKKAWSSPRMDAACDGLRLLHVDYPDYGKKGQKGTHLDEKNADFLLRPRVYHFPTIAMYDAKGVMVGREEGYRGNAESMAKLVLSWKTRLSERDVLFAKAGQTNGIEKAAFIGRGLDLFPLALARQHGEWIKLIGKHDPEDKTGYLTKYVRFNAGDLSSEARAKGKRRQYREVDALLAEIKKQLGVAVLRPVQRQELLAARAACYSYMLESQEQWLRTLGEIAAIDPDSIPGQGARGLLWREKKRKTFRSLVARLEKKPDDRKSFLAVLDLDDEVQGLLPDTYKVYRKENRSPLPMIGHEGHVTASSHRKNDNAWRKHLVTYERYNGVVDTEEQIRPWVKVSFKKPRTILHVTTVMGHKRNTIAPFVVEISEDGETWKEIFRSAVKKYCYHARLNKPEKALHVRCRCDSGEKTRFHISNLWVYGM